MKHGGVARYIASAGIALCVLALLSFVLHTYRTVQSVENFSTAMRALLQKPSFNEQMSLYQDFLARVGAVRAQETLLAIMPNTSLTHVLNHETGRFLFRQKGIDGIRICTQAFADSCFHGFISAVILERGFDELDALLEACARGTTGDQLQQCVHGIGHGFLENVGYELPKAVALCEETFGDGTKEARNCYDGVFMENNFGNFNVPPEDRWYSQEDPMYPCNETFVLSRAGAHEFCWFMQSQLTLNEYAYPQFRGSPKAAGAYCESLVHDGDKESCYEGIGRQVQLLSRDNPENIKRTCAELPEERAAECVWNAAKVAYIYGNRTPQTTRICEEAEQARKNRCYSIMYEAIAISFSEKKDRKNACARDIEPAARKEECSRWMDGDTAETI